MIYNRHVQLTRFSTISIISLLLLYSSITISFAFLLLPSSSRTFQNTCLEQQRRPSPGQRRTPSDARIISFNNVSEKTDLLADISMDKDRCKYNRRDYISETTSMASILMITSIPTPSDAASTNAQKEEKPSTFEKGKSRSQGYKLKRTPSEWSTVLSLPQLNVLRRSKTERQRSSILEKEKRSGKYVCAGCDSDLFASTAKFDSGTGWPSFESVIDVKAIELEDVGWGLKALDGAEVRCKTCGGHLGDLFADGRRYGSKTGKRYCINGAALIFLPDGDGKPLRGDIPPPNKVIQYEPSLRRD